MCTRSTLRMLAVLLAMAAPLGASAAPFPLVVGDKTSLELTAASTLASLGITVQPVGTASLLPTAPDPTAVFPITGGVLTPGGSSIKHDGSGLSLSLGTDFLLLLNLEVVTGTIGDPPMQADVVTIDDVGGTLVSATANDVEVFTLRNLMAPSKNVLTADVHLGATGAATINALFGTSLATGLKIGEATIDLVVVPVPAAGVLFGSALAGVVALRRRDAGRRLER